MGEFKEVTSLVPLVLGRMGTFGLILTLFCAGTIFAERRGATLPALITEWARVGFVLGFVLIALRIALWIASGVQRVWHRHIENRHRAAETKRNEIEGIANLQTLSRDEAQFLLRLLESGQTRFQLDRYLTSAESLVSKHILTFISDVSWNEWICGLHPQIEKQRTQLASRIRKGLTV